MTNESDQRILRSIAIFKLCKCSGLILLACGAFEVAQGDEFARFTAWLQQLPLAAGHRFVHDAIVALLELTPHRMDIIGSVALAYAGLFGTEAYGLWKQRRWAEYLTVIATASLVPFELWALIEEFTAFRLLALIVNAAIVIWMVSLLRRKHVKEGT
jgi:uncharacterized membrane protein (DUF2068 family)